MQHGPVAVGRACLELKYGVCDYDGHDCYRECVTKASCQEIIDRDSQGSFAACVDPC